MMIEDYQAALIALHNAYGDIRIKKILMAYNGIVFYSTDGATYKWWFYSETITLLESDWRKK